MSKEVVELFHQILYACIKKFAWGRIKEVSLLVVDMLCVFYDGEWIDSRLQGWMYSPIIKTRVNVYIREELCYLNIHLYDNFW